VEFVPVVFEHAARFIGQRPWEVSRSPRLLYEAHAAAYREYHHRPLVVGIDVYNVEAEAYGARVEDPGGNEVPSVEGRRCSSVTDILTLKSPDLPRGGRIPVVLEAAIQLRESFSGAEVRIPLSGPFSIACALVGFQDLLMAMLEDPDPVAAALHRLAEDQIAVTALFAREGFRVIFFESSASPPLVSPSLFESVLAPSLGILVRESARLTGEFPPMILGGDTARVVPALLGTGTRYVVCPAETDGKKFMKLAGAHPDVAVRVNVRPGLFASGSHQDIREALDAAMDLAGGRPNVCIGTGVLPYNADPVLVKEAMQYVEGKKTPP
jgi:uroporphyrinogen decarboxylase